MSVKLSVAQHISAANDQIHLCSRTALPEKIGLTPNEKIHLELRLKSNPPWVCLPRGEKFIHIVLFDESKNQNKTSENIRCAGSQMASQLNRMKTKKVSVQNHSTRNDAALLFAEGMALASYEFNKYKTKKKSANSIHEIAVVGIELVALKEKQIIIDSLWQVRDLINSPANKLNSSQLAEVFNQVGTKAGLKVEVWDKAKIEAMKFGGLLCVNQGSVDPPSFTIMEWKPENAKNKKPIVLVGKGVTYDTGGLSLKPTSSMDTMKSDMSGASIVFGTMICAARTKLPLNLIALIPSTDNRPGFNAFAPGDIIEMFDGSTVEMLNSDAEGRMILADALAFAKKYSPELVIDAATLTGAASRAIGQHGIVYLATADTTETDSLENTGEEVYERLVRFPLWEEYADQLKSDIADVKNVGGAAGGANTAAKFLERFTSYPWIHLDIAGASFYSSSDGYRTKGATGFGMRLLYHFLKKKSENVG